MGCVVFKGNRIEVFVYVVVHRNLSGNIVITHGDIFLLIVKTKKLKIGGLYEGNCGMRL